MHNNQWCDHINIGINNQWSTKMDHLTDSGSFKMKLNLEKVVNDGKLAHDFQDVGL